MSFKAICDQCNKKQIFDLPHEQALFIARFNGWIIDSKERLCSSCAVKKLKEKATTNGFTITEILSFHELRKANVERCEKSFKHSINDWSPADWAMATTGEVGELCNLLKKRHRGEEINQQEIEKEFADVAIYLDLWAARCGVDLTEAVRSKFNEVSDRVGSDIRL